MTKIRQKWKNSRPWLIFYALIYYLFMISVFLGTIAFKGRIESKIVTLSLNSALFVMDLYKLIAYCLVDYKR